MLMVQNIKVNGSMTNNMDMDMKYGLMAHHIKGSLVIVLNMEKVKY